MTIKEYHETKPDQAGAEFLARWITSMVETNIPQTSRFGETTAEADIVKGYMNRLVQRFGLYSKDDFYEAWDNTVIDCTREQAEHGRFPSWTFGILEIGLKKHLKGKPIDSSRLLPEPVPDPAEEQKRQEINEQFKNPTPEFACKMAYDMASHIEAGLDFMIVGPHLVKVFEVLEDLALPDWVKETRKACKYAEQPDIAFRKRLIHHITKT